MTIKRRLLVTGGSGYLGGWVVRLARGRWDVAATYLTHPADEPGADWRRLDVRDEAAANALVADVRPDVIAHTAAINPGQGTDFEAVNTVGTRHIARAATKHGARLIHVSSDVLFDGRKGNYVEEDPPSPINPYGHSKALAEGEVHASGAEAVIVRTSLIYGWRPRLGRQMRWMLGDLQAGKPVRLYTDELRCPIWVESLGAAVVELADLDYTGILHVAGAQPLSRYDFGVQLLRFHGVDLGAVVPVSARGGTPHRPLDGTLDSSRARALLRTPLPGVDEVLSKASK
jgi:dTDP-4-dehydrorhamnose reductase